MRQGQAAGSRLSFLDNRSIEPQRRRNHHGAEHQRASGGAKSGAGLAVTHLVSRSTSLLLTFLTEPRRTLTQALYFT